jgi:hypothetical protein
MVGGSSSLERPSCALHHRSCIGFQMSRNWRRVVPIGHLLVGRLSSKLGAILCIAKYISSAVHSSSMATGMCGRSNGQERFHEPPEMNASCDNDSHMEDLVASAVDIKVVGQPPLRDLAQVSIGDMVCLLRVGELSPWQHISLRRLGWPLPSNPSKPVTCATSAAPIHAMRGHAR